MGTITSLTTEDLGLGERTPMFPQAKELFRMFQASGGKDASGSFRNLAWNTVANAAHDYYEKKLTLTSEQVEQYGFRPKLVVGPEGGLMIELDNVRATELQAKVTQLEKEAEQSKSPCGHYARYAYTEDGGKNIVCLLCERDGERTPSSMDIKLAVSVALARRKPISALSIAEEVIAYLREAKKLRD